MKGFVLRRLQPHASAIIQHYRDGESFAEIAERFDCGWGTIRRFLISHDVPLRQEPRKLKLDAVGADVIAAFRSGADLAAIAARYEVQPQTVRNYLIERGILSLADESAALDAS